MTLTLLAAHDLTVARGGLRVVERVSFDLQAGEALVLRGPNGIGKTTILRTIAGLQAPVAGRVEVAEDTVAYAAHSDGIKPSLTVTENLEFWAQIFGGKQVPQALCAMNLADLGHRPAGALSAGQKRRLGLARLLVTGRPVWVLDEPTVSLDAASVELFVQAIRIHLSGGGAALMATHIDFGLPEARFLDLSPFRAKSGQVEKPAGFNEAFG